MDELAIVKLSELRSKIAAIPVKLIVSILFMAGFYWDFSMDVFMEQPVQNIFMTIIIYGLISYLWLCIKITRNWIIGVIFAIALIAIISMNADKIGQMGSSAIFIAIAFGGPLIDIYYILRYSSLKRKLRSQKYENDDYYYEKYDEYDDDKDEQDYEEDESFADTTLDFFEGCNDINSIKRRYKDLCKVYHPDNGNGSAEIFAKINEEYNDLILDYEQ